MENATKALMMAASILLTIMILGLLVFTFNRIKDAKETDEESMLTEQTNQFNKRFTAYEKEIRGNELYSLINRMLDYNELIDKNKGTSQESGHDKMEIYIEIENPTKVFHFTQHFVTQGVAKYNLEFFKNNSFSVNGTQMNLRNAIETIEADPVYKGQDKLQKIVSELDTYYSNNGNNQQQDFVNVLKEMRV